VPWCDACSKFWNPNSVGADGVCPTCGRALPAPTTIASGEDGRQVRRTRGREGRRGPGGLQGALALQLLVGAVALYLGWRAVQGVQWALQHL